MLFVDSIIQRACKHLFSKTGYCFTKARTQIVKLRNYFLL